MKNHLVWILVTSAIVAMIMTFDLGAERFAEARSSASVIVSLWIGYWVRSW